MKLTPLDIYNKEFKKSAFGYNVNEVQDFLDEVGVAYEKLLKEINSLKDENGRMKEKLDSYQDLDERLGSTLKEVQKTVQEQTKQAEKKAANIVQSAKMEAEKIKEGTKLKIQKEYKKLSELKESKNYFKIRFKTLLESHLELLEKDKNDEELDSNYDFAVSEHSLDE